MRIFTDLLWMAANFFIAYQSVLALEGAFAFPEVSPTLGVVKGYVEAMLPFSFLLMNLRLGMNYWSLIRNNSLMDLADIDGGEA
ncbi:hypothetical protein [Desulfocurvus sp. DL9XJH121]